MPQCSDCWREFSSTQALHAHCRDKANHAYCEDCERLFVHFQALNQHLQNSPAHQDESYEESDSESEAANSDDDELPYCGACDRWFINRLSKYQHLAASSSHNWCFVCSRDFSSPTALDQHSSSRVHKACDLPCPLCSKTFKIPSAIALHIESGACHNISRHQVTAAVHSLGIVPTISITRRLHGSSSAARTTITYAASEMAFNGSAYECYLCHRTFSSLMSLNAHLNSPAHDAKEFKCPSCRKEFKLISGLIQHIETETCGVARFQQVEDFAHNLADQFSRLLKF